MSKDQSFFNGLNWKKVVATATAVLVIAILLFSVITSVPAQADDAANEPPVADSSRVCEITLPADSPLWERAKAIAHNFGCDFGIWDEEDGNVKIQPIEQQVGSDNQDVEVTEDNPSAN